MALSPKERERIIEEETLRYDTRMNLHKKACAERPVRWPWIVLGAALVYFLWAWIFCGPGYCDMSGKHCKTSMGHGGHKCAHGNWAPEDSDADVEPGQPIVKPGKK